MDPRFPQQQPQPTPEQPLAPQPPAYQAPPSSALPQPLRPSAYPAEPQPGTAAIQPQPLASPQQYSPNYLDQIATNESAKGPSKFAVIALIAGILLAALFAVLLITGSKGPDTTNQLLQIDARTDTLQEAVTSQQKHLTENSIATSNATLGSTLTTMSTTMTTFIPKKSDQNKDIKAKEKTYSAELIKTLDDAYQRGTLDRIYTAQMSYELRLLRGMLVKLEKNASKKDVKAFCSTSIANIDTILKQYSEFNASKS